MRQQDGPRTPCCWPKRLPPIDPSGYKSIRFMRVYAVVVGLADLMQVCATQVTAAGFRAAPAATLSSLQIILVVLFMVPDARDATFDAVHLPDTARNKLQEYSTAVGALFVVIVLLQLVALLLILMRCANLDEHYDSDTEESGLLGHYKPVRGGGTPSRTQPSSAATSLGGLLEEDSPPPPSGPRLTYSILHDKYARR